MNGLLLRGNVSETFSEIANSKKSHAAGLIRLGDAVFDPSRRTVRLGGKETALEPRLADVLGALIRTDGPASREYLLDAAWGQGEGSDEALTQVISKLRKALGDDARPYRMIETAPKLGYRLAVEPLKETPAPSALPAFIERVVAAISGRRQFAGGFAAGVACCLVLFAAMTLINPPRQIEREIECGPGANPAACEAALAMMEE